MHACRSTLEDPTLERVVARREVARLLDGVTAGVVGLIAATLVGLLRAGVTSLPAFLIFALALAASYAFKGRATVAFVVLGSGLLGWLLLR